MATGADAHLSPGELAAAAKAAARALGFEACGIADVHSSLEAAGALDAWLEIEPRFADALLGMEVGHELIVIAWLHQAKRDVLKGHPRNDSSRPLTGVFYTRSPARPNPLGLYATSGDVRDQPKVADAASDLLQDVFGKDKNPCRLVYGVASLPLGTPVELEVIFEVAG